MSEDCAFKSSSNSRVGRQTVMLAAANGIAFAAAPTFAVLAGLTLVLEAGPPDVLCAATQHGSSLNGMAVMYALMGVFHSTPWLRLVSSRSDGTRPT